MSMQKAILLLTGVMLGGGQLAFAEDPYIEGNGNQFFSVPYYTTPHSKVVVDFKTTDRAVSQGIVGSSNAVSGAANVVFHSNMYGNLEGGGAGAWSHMLVGVTDAQRLTRMTGTVDLVTGYASCAASSRVLDGYVTPTVNSPLPLGVFGRTAECRRHAR